MLAGVPSNQKLREAFLSVYRVVQMILLYVCAASRLLHERWCCTMNSGVVKASNMRGFVHEERVSFLRTLAIKAYCAALALDVKDSGRSRYHHLLGCWLRITPCRELSPFALRLDHYERCLGTE